MCEMKEIKGVNKTMQAVEKRYCDIMETMQIFNAPVAIVPINKDRLKAFKFGVWESLNDKVKVRRRKDRFHEGYLCFDTIMETGGQFGEHFHGDLIESTEVVYGEMYDTYDRKTYKRGDVVHYDKGQKHTPVAKVKTRLHVLFKP